MNTLFSDFIKHDLWVKKSYEMIAHFNLQSKCSILNHRYNLAKNNGGVGVKPAMSVKHFNLQSSQVRKMAKICLNQSLTYIHTYPHSNPKCIHCWLTRLLLCEKTLEGHLSPLHPPVTPMFRIPYPSPSTGINPWFLRCWTLNLPGDHLNRLYQCSCHEILKSYSQH